MESYDSNAFNFFFLEVLLMQPGSNAMKSVAVFRLLVLMFLVHPALSKHGGRNATTSDAKGRKSDPRFC